jgi:hypothetical protein
LKTAKVIFASFENDIFSPLQGVQKNVRLLGTRFTNAISCFEPGPQEPDRDMSFNAILFSLR